MNPMCKICAHYKTRSGNGMAPGYPCTSCVRYASCNDIDLFRPKEKSCEGCVHEDPDDYKYPCSTCIMTPTKSHYTKKKECPECQRWIDRVKVLEDRLRQIREVAK